MLRCTKCVIGTSKNGSVMYTKFEMLLQQDNGLQELQSLIGYSCDEWSFFKGVQCKQQVLSPLPEFSQVQGIRLNVNIYVASRQTQSFMSVTYIFFLQQSSNASYPAAVALTSSASKPVLAIT